MPFNSTKSGKIGIFGATGNVGRNIIALLLERKIVTPADLELFASKTSAGKALMIAGHEFTIRDTDSCDFDKLKLCLLATDSDISRELIRKAISHNVVIVDSSSLHRLDPDVPLIVAPINKNLVSVQQSRLYAMANCIASPISLVLAPLHRVIPIKRVSIVTYQSTSGAGKAAMDELYNETVRICDGDIYERQVFTRQIAFNVIPQIDKVMEDGFTYEEFKIMREIQKIVAPELKITATSVRVPVMIGHSSALTIEFERGFNLSDIQMLLSKAPSVKLSEDHYHTPIEVVGSDDVHVGRMRRDPSVNFGLHLWLCSDNLRRGAATDAVEVTEELLHQLG